MTRAPTAYTVHCLPGMLAYGRTCKTFASPSGFEKLGAQRLEGPRVSGGAAGRAAPASLAIIFGGCVAPETAQGPDGNHGDNLPIASAGRITL